jgi:serine/threonine-protein kinase HipA
LIENPLLNGFTLSPAYDLLATALVNPADTEELALTLNGKKKKLKYEDFLSAYERSGLTKKVLDTTLENFFYCLYPMKEKVLQSFLPDEYKEKFLLMFQERCARLLRVSGER